MDEDRALTVKLGRLLDCNDPVTAASHGYFSYGRFALLRNGQLWFGDTRSSHPSITARGWYWAVDGQGCVVLSARGAKLDGEFLFTEGKWIIAALLGELERGHVIKRPGSIRLVP
jgi:hypothetical protein